MRFLQLHKQLENNFESGRGGGNPQRTLCGFKSFFVHLGPRTHFYGTRYLVFNFSPPLADDTMTHS